MRGGRSLLAEMISSVKRVGSGCTIDISITGARVAGTALMQGMDPLGAIAGDEEWQTSRLPRTGSPSGAAGTVSTQNGEKAVTATASRQMSAVPFMDQS